MTGPQPTGFEITQAEYDTFEAAVAEKMVELGLDPSDPESQRTVLRDWWGMVTDFTNAQRYVRSRHLDQLKAARDKQDTDRPELDRRITDLERVVRP